MLGRRGFLLLLPAEGRAGPTGIWLALSGLVSLPRRMVLKLWGSCSFCSSVPPAVRAAVGVVDRPPRMCDRCVLVSVHGFGEAPPAPRSPLRAPSELEALGPGVEEQVRGVLEQLSASRDAHVEGIAAGVRRRQRAHDDPEVLDALEKLRATSIEVATAPSGDLQHILAAHGDAQRRVAELLGWPEQEVAPPVCAFCDASRSDEHALVAGPGVFACTGCVREAAALLAANGI